MRMFICIVLPRDGDRRARINRQASLGKGDEAAP